MPEIKARFPARGSIRRGVLVYRTPPERIQDKDGTFLETPAGLAERAREFETRKHITIDVRLEDTDKVDQRVRSFQLEATKERDRMKDEDSLLHSLEWVKARDALDRSVVKDTVEKLYGVIIVGKNGADLDLEGVDPGELVGYLRDQAMLEDVALAARTAQRPTAAQLKN